MNFRYSFYEHEFFDNIICECYYEKLFFVIFLITFSFNIFQYALIQKHEIGRILNQRELLTAGIFQDIIKWMRVVGTLPVMIHLHMWSCESYQVLFCPEGEGDLSLINSIEGVSFPARVMNCDPL